MLELSPYDEDSDIKCSLTDLIFTNTKIVDKSKHWSLILFQESIAVNRLKPPLNHGTKASKRSINLKLIISLISFLIVRLHGEYNILV